MLKPSAFIIFKQTAAYESHLVTKGDGGMRGSVIRLDGDGLFEQRQRLVRCFRHSGKSIWEGAQVEIISVQAVRTLAFGAFDFSLAQRRLDRAYNAHRQLVLHGENIVERAVVSFGPDMRGVRRIDKLTGDPHPIAELAHAAFENIAHAQFAAYLLHVDRPL